MVAEGHIGQFFSIANEPDNDCGYNLADQSVGGDLEDIVTYVRAFANKRSGSNSNSNCTGNYQLY